MDGEGTQSTYMFTSVFEPWMRKKCPQMHTRAIDQVTSELSFNGPATLAKLDSRHVEVN